MNLKDLTNEGLLKEYELTIIEGVKQANFRKGGMTKKQAKHEKECLTELFRRLNIPNERLNEFINKGT